MTILIALMGVCFAAGGLGCAIQQWRRGWYYPKWTYSDTLEPQKITREKNPVGYWINLLAYIGAIIVGTYITYTAFADGP